MEEQYTKSTRVNRKGNALKEHAKMKRLQKEQERTSRPSSCRIGKNQKKQIARTNIILDEQNERTEQLEELPPREQSVRTVLRRQRRKQGHRDRNATRIEQTEHLEGVDPTQSNDEFYDNGFSWGRWMMEISEQAHKERRQREGLAKVNAIIEKERLILHESSNWRASHANFMGDWDLDDDDYSDYLEPCTKFRETRCCTGHCVIYEKV